MAWPNDADGDVLRRLKDNGFDFTKEYEIEFNVDFDNWPPPEEAINKVKENYPNTEIVEPEEGYEGYLLFQVRVKVSYDLVTSIQRKVSELVKPYGGVCESWGVMH